MHHTHINELLTLHNKTAIVTGGAMGIGFGIAARLAEAGAQVVIADLNQAAGEKAAAELRAQGGVATFLQMDVSREDDCIRAVDVAVATYGGIDIVVNNAGIYPIAPLMDMPAATFAHIIEVNLHSVFFLTKAAAAVMIPQGRGGKIITVTSIDALHPSAVGLAAYDASKHGVWGFVKNSALELAPHNIQVNAIAPGGINTPGAGAGAPKTPQMEAIQEKFIARIPMGRMGEPDDIGKVALFLASDLSSYMTGTQVVVDGGALLA